MQIDNTLTADTLKDAVDRLWALSDAKLNLIAQEYDHTKGSPVFTECGKYTTRGWTEWTQGFEYGSQILQFDATGQEEWLASGRDATVEHMSPHVTHFGVHDHGFNNVSTYGSLLRLVNEGRIEASAWERHFYELALKCSGAVQARRWSSIADGAGYIYSFNGPHSLFADTIRSLRALGLSHQLGHCLMGENDRRVSLLERLVQHAETTARFIVYYGEGRDVYDVCGRVVHECIFNMNDGAFRCPSSQQGYSPFSTWTRGLAWVMCGFAEQLPYIASRPEQEFEQVGGKARVEAMMRRATQATCDFYIGNTPQDGIPYWDTGAPRLHELGDWISRPADPFNPYEPVDSSAAAIAAQALLRFGQYMGGAGDEAAAQRYVQAGLTVLKALFDEPYISTDPAHQGLILHSVYHRPNGWDRVPEGAEVPCGESSMWGDYHAREAALSLQRMRRGDPPLTYYLK